MMKKAIRYIKYIAILCVLAIVGLFLLGLYYAQYEPAASVIKRKSKDLNAHIDSFVAVANASCEFFLGFMENHRNMDADRLWVFSHREWAIGYDEEQNRVHFINGLYINGIHTETYEITDTTVASAAKELLDLGYFISINAGPYPDCINVTFRKSYRRGKTIDLSGYEYRTIPFPSESKETFHSIWLARGNEPYRIDSRGNEYSGAKLYLGNHWFYLEESREVD